MKVSSVYPVLITDTVAATADFYRSHFDFEDTFASDWYVSLRHRTAPVQELAILQLGHPSIPVGDSTRCQGLVINIEVEDASAEYDRLVEGAGLPVVAPLRDESFGQRHFMVRDPAGNLVDVIENIAATGEFADSYVDDGRGSA